MRLIVGLGNPGPKYEGSRHNVGFAIVDQIASVTKTSFDETGRIQKALSRMKSAGLYVATASRYRGRPIALAKPLTFMNRSGDAVAKLKSRYAVDDQDMLVIVDDIHLELGTIRLKGRGGDGGHNGLQSITEQLDSDNFPRMRIGVGSTFPRGRQSDYVLSPFDPDEKPLVDEVVKEAALAALTFVTDGIVTAMNRYNKKISLNDSSEHKN
jgi:PTH1 family peptidyl-tRNA hydrolase